MQRNGPGEGGNMKKLYRSQKNKIIAGVCGGVAEYLDVDPVLIRLIAVLFFFAGGATLIAYIVGMIIIPSRPPEGTGEVETVQEQNSAPSFNVETGSPGRAGSLIIGIILIVFGIHFLLRNIPFFHPYYWWFWDMGWQFFWPSVLILVGLFVIFRGTRK
jgi:phage shock protein C